MLFISKRISIRQHAMARIGRRIHGFWTGRKNLAGLSIFSTPTTAGLLWATFLPFIPQRDSHSNRRDIPCNWLSVGPIFFLITWWTLPTLVLPTLETKTIILQLSMANGIC